MAADEGKSRGLAPPPPADYSAPPHQYYGTFPSAPSYHQPPAMGFPQPAPPPGSASPSAPPYPPMYYAHGYQAVTGYATVTQGIPLRMPRLPCCGIGWGWFLFIAGFFLPAFPWYIGALIYVCGRVDYREKPGFVACTIAAFLAAIAVLFGLTMDDD